MSTTIRPELSEKNKYWIEKHRYYELKHFCLQYSIWKKAYSALDGLTKKSSDLILISEQRELSNPTAKYAEAKIFYANRIEMIEQVAIETDISLADYILQAVTKGISYDYLKTKLEIPCCKDTYYELYRKFFWLLNKRRD